MPAQRVDPDVTDEPDVEVRVDWGVRLPDGVICAAQSEYDVDTIIQAAKALNPRAKYRKIKQLVTTTVEPWVYA